MAGSPVRWSRIAPLLLAATVVVVYLPSLGGEFLNWDDPWLVRDNPRLVRASVEDLRAAWTDFSDATRVTYGAEYLPVRDTTLWIESRVHGLTPQLLRLTNLGIYVAAVLLMRIALLRAIGGGTGSGTRIAEVAAWVFALHPVHVESVAWIASRKDVLALLFVAGALAVHAGTSRARPIVVPLLLALAHLSKAMTVTAGGLLVAQDLVARRRPDWRVYARSLAVALAAVAIHVRVGAIVGMTTSPAGGSRVNAAATMAPVVLRYVERLFAGARLSVVYDVPLRTWRDPAAWLGAAALVAWVAGAAFAWRREKRLPLATLLWFALPLLPVSQVLFPLQNLMADRYLLLPAMAPALAIGAVASRGPVGALVAASWLLVAAPATALRALRFSDDVALWGDAVAKTRSTPIAPYQLALAWEAYGDAADAADAYGEALRRAPGRDETARRATNNLSKLLAAQGRLSEAESMARRGVRLWPDDPKALNNLAEIVAREGHHAEARELYDDLVRRFPRYELGRRNFERRYGPR